MNFNEAFELWLKGGGLWNYAQIKAFELYKEMLQSVEGFKIIALTDALEVVFNGIPNDSLIYESEQNQK